MTPTLPTESVPAKLPLAMAQSKEIEVHDVGLVVMPGEDGKVRVSLFDTEGHGGEAELSLDAGDETQAGFVRRYAGLHSSPAERQAFGFGLFTRMMTDIELAVAWTGIQGAAARRPLRLVVESHPGTGAFSRLPLELLRDVEGDVFARPGSGIVRTFAGNAPRAFTMPAQPRVLFAWAHAKDDDFDPQPHIDALRAVYGDGVVVLPNATLPSLRAQLRTAAEAGEPFHFVQLLAHGAEGNGQPIIILANAGGGRSQEVPANLLAKAIRGTGVELVFLCSCQSGIGFAGVGQQILAADVPCVIACQADLPVRGSAELAGRFHQLLRDTREPALAIARARREAYDAGDAWSVPVLLARMPMPERATRPRALFGLPVRAATWQSRPELEDEALAALRDNRLVSVLGLPGIGKTEIANEVARRAVTGGLCNSALYFIVQPDNTPDRIVMLLAASLGRPELRDLAELGAMLDAGGPRLLVLDNAEDLMRDAFAHPKCQELLHALLQHTRHLRLLLSSRWASGCTGEIPVDVGPMSAPETTQLLLRELEAQGVSVDHEAPESAQLVEHLRGHPRAVHLLAARYARETTTAAAMLTALDGAIATTEVHWTLLGLQTAFERLPEAQLARLRVLAAALDLAVAHLGATEPDALTALHRLTLFPDGLPERVALLVSGGIANISLQRLYRRRLVEWRNGRAYLPVPLHAHLARKRPADFDDVPAWAAVTLGMAIHANACFEQITNADIPGGVSRFLLDLDTVGLIERRLRPQPEVPWGRPFAHLVAPAAQLLALADKIDAARTAADLGCRIARSHGDRLALANCLQSLGDLLTSIHDLDGARAAYDQALRIFRDIRDRLGEANCLQNLGDLLARIDDLDNARAAYDKALPVHRDICDRLGEANCLQSLGDLLTRIQDLDGARAAYDQALPIYRDIRARLGEANCLRSLGDLLTRIQDLDGARAAYDQALPIYRDIRARLGEANCLQSLGDLLTHIQDLDGARAAYDQALPIFRDIRERLGEANCLQSLGDLLRRTVDFDGARAAYDQALGIFRDIRERLGEANCLQAFGLHEMQAGRPEAAFAKLVAVLPLRRELQDRLGEQATLGYLARAAAAVRAFDHALVLSERSLDLGRAIDDRFGQTINLELQAGVAMNAQDAATGLAAMLVHRQVSMLMGDRKGAERFAETLTAAQKALPPNTWRGLAADPETFRSAGIAAALERIRQRGEDPLRLPDPGSPGRTPPPRKT